MVEISVLSHDAISVDWFTWEGLVAVDEVILWYDVLQARIMINAQGSDLCSRFGFKLRIIICAQNSDLGCNASYFQYR